MQKYCNIKFEERHVFTYDSSFCESIFDVFRLYKEYLPSVLDKNSNKIITNRKLRFTRLSSFTHIQINQFQ